MTSLFAAGHEVGRIARDAHPDGVLIGPDNNLHEALRVTSELMAAGVRKPLFEATFSYEDVLVRVDLLLPEEDGWRLAEVKSTASAKSYHLGDIATQLWVLRGAGVALSGASIRHIDTRFIYQREGDYEGYLMDADVAEAAHPLVADRSRVVAEAKAVVAGEEPDRPFGPHCSAPYECPFVGHCHQDRPKGPSYPVTLLPGQAGKAAAERLLQLGVCDLAQAPDEVRLDGLLGRIREATCSGEPYHDAAAFASDLQAWPWPRFYLDFETISFAIPRWIAMRPFEPVPFQFSCHVETEDGRLRHEMFLDLSGADPSRACAEALIQVMGEQGAIIAYNAAFERNCILALGGRHPDLQPLLQAIAERVVDLLPLVRRHYYHRDMLGSFSIKAVLPARLPELSYDELQGVQDGMAAQAAYIEATSAETSLARREELDGQLRAYCTRDTLAMVRLASSLAEAS